MAINPTGTGVVDIKSDLVRRKWMTEGLLQKAATSWWAPYKGKSQHSIIFTTTDISAKAGHTVVFDFNGALAGKPVRGKTQAEGTGEQKRKFSDKLTVDVYRYVVDNGDKFDGVNIGDLSINEHSNSRSLLGDLWIRSADQAYFDIAQQSADFQINLGDEFTFDKLLDIENIVKMGEGFDVTPAGITHRAPLKPFIMADGRPMWLMVIDTAMKTRLLSSTQGIQALLSDTDVRGNGNRLLSGVIGRIGNFMIVEAPSFFGDTEGDILNSQGYYNYDSTGVITAGLRQAIYTNATPGKNASGTLVGWTGTKGFNDEVDNVDHTSTIRESRGLILGACAMQMAMGRQPDYHFKSHDFDKFSESCLEVWIGSKAAKLYAENTDYDAARVAGYNFGIVGLNLQHKALR